MDRIDEVDFLRWKIKELEERLSRACQVVAEGRRCSYCGTIDKPKTAQGLSLSGVPGDDRNENSV